MSDSVQAWIRSVCNYVSTSPDGTGYWSQMPKMSTLPGNSGACIPMSKGLRYPYRCIDKGTNFNMQKPTCTFVIDMLESGVSQWSTSGQVQWPGISPGPTDDIGQKTFQAFQEQQQIGWDQGIRGWWSKKWGQANGLDCISRLHQGDTDIHARWMSSLVNSMWQYRPVFKISSYLRFFSSYLRFFCLQYIGSF